MVYHARHATVLIRKVNGPYEGVAKLPNCRVLEE